MSIKWYRVWICGVNYGEFLSTVRKQFIYNVYFFYFLFFFFFEDTTKADGNLTKRNPLFPFF